MEYTMPELEDLSDLHVPILGAARHPSPLRRSAGQFISDNDHVFVYADCHQFHHCQQALGQVPAFQMAGPREKLFFNPLEMTCGIVTCGGLCPGLNDVIRSIVLALHWQYGVKKVLGFGYGYEGMSSNARRDPRELRPEDMGQIQHRGGTILGTSRGPQDIDDMIEQLRRHEVNALFVLGGDGTFSGAHALSQRLRERDIPIAVIGVPKTIDNDIFCCERTFGYYTAVEEARHALAGAHEEATAAWNGVGLVKLMGRDSGFIAVGATLANSDVNFCLIPEVPFELTGEQGLLARLERRLERRKHALIVVAEGAGQTLAGQTGPAATDRSGNRRYQDIGLFLKEQITAHFQSRGEPLTLKYIDPSYTIRSCPANAQDSALCILFGQHAVHAAMAGKTDMFVGYWNHRFTHVPLSVAAGRRKQIDPDSEVWQTVLALTE